MNLPINRKAEVGVIGACLDGGLETTLQAGEILPARCFYHDDVRFAYECFLSDANRGQCADVQGIADRWRAAHAEIPFPADLWTPDMHGADNGEWLFSGRGVLLNRAETVLDLYRRRQAMIAAHALMEGAERLYEPLAETMAEFDSLMDQSETNAPPILDGKQLAHQVTDDLERRHNLQGQLSGIDTGFDDLNKMTDGLQAGEVWIIGARPSVGKTALALNIADHVSITQGIPSLFVSLEMSAVALGRRLVSMRGQIHGGTVRSGKFTTDNLRSVTVANSRIGSSPLYVLDAPGGVRVNQLCHSIRAAIKRWGIKVVFIDYLQKIRPETKGEKRTYEIGDVSSQLVELVKREKINLFALAQLNRENEKEKGRAPRLSDLADSKSIEADADFVGLLDRPVNGDECRATLRVAKQRDGERGTILLRFEGWHCRFKPGTNQESPQI